MDKVDQAVVDTQPTKAFGPTSKIIKAKGADLYQKQSVDEQEQSLKRGSSSFQSDFVDYQPDQMGEMSRLAYEEGLIEKRMMAMHKDKSVEELT